MSVIDPLAVIRDSICQSGDRLIACLDGLTPAQLNWEPAAPGANSVYAIVNHAIGTQEGHIIGRIFGEPVAPRERAGWDVAGNAGEPLRERWGALRPRVYRILENASGSDLDKACEHPRLGSMSGWQMLLLVDRRTAEHVGHAELTRDLAKAAGI